MKHTRKVHLNRGIPTPYGSLPLSFCGRQEGEMTNSLDRTTCIKCLVAHNAPIIRLRNRIRGLL